MTPAELQTRWRVVMRARNRSWCKFLARRREPSSRESRGLLFLFVSPAGRLCLHFCRERGVLGEREER